jgi:hypothetical protein
MVAELVESLRKPSAESSLLELSRGEAKDIQGPTDSKKIFAYLQKVSPCTEK